MAKIITTTLTVDDPWVSGPGDWVTTTDSTVPWNTAFPTGTAAPWSGPHTTHPSWPPPVSVPGPFQTESWVRLSEFQALEKELEEAKARIERLVESLTLLSQGEPVP